MDVTDVLIDRAIMAAAIVVVAFVVALGLVALRRAWRRLDGL